MQKYINGYMGILASTVRGVSSTAGSFDLLFVICISLSLAHMIARCILPLITLFLSEATTGMLPWVRFTFEKEGSSSVISYAFFRSPAISVTQEVKHAFGCCNGKCGRYQENGISSGLVG